MRTAGRVAIGDRRHIRVGGVWRSRRLGGAIASVGRESRGLPRIVGFRLRTGLAASPGAPAVLKQRAIARIGSYGRIRIGARAATSGDSRKDRTAGQEEREAIEDGTFHVDQSANSEQAGGPPPARQDVATVLRRLQKSNRSMCYDRMCRSGRCDTFSRRLASDVRIRWIESEPQSGPTLQGLSVVRCPWPVVSRQLETGIPRAAATEHGQNGNQQRTTGNGQLTTVSPP